MGSILKHSMQLIIIVLDTITEKASVSVIILQFFYPIRTNILILIQGSMIQNIRSEERKNARVAENYENQQRLEKFTIEFHSFDNLADADSFVQV